MVEQINDKIQIHQSDLTMASRCAVQYKRRKIDGDIAPPGIALITGSSVHLTVERNLTAKIETDELLPVKQVMDIARDDIDSRLQDQVLFTEEEAEDIEGTKGKCIDMTVTLAALHATGLAPQLDPKSVERKWVVTLNGFPFDLAGQWDIEENTGALRDTKTAGKTPPQSDADNSLQLTMYALAKKVCDGEEPSALYIDALVKLKNPKIVTFQTTRNDVQRQVLLNRIERFAEMVEKEVFIPANPTDWWCSEKFCGFAPTCEFFAGKVQI